MQLASFRQLLSLEKNIVCTLLRGVNRNKAGYLKISGLDIDKAKQLLTEIVSHDHETLREAANLLQIFIVYIHNGQKYQFKSRNF